MKKYFFIIIFSFLAVNLFFVLEVKAVDTAIVDRCWTKQACVEFVRNNFDITDDAEAQKLFYQGADAISECSYKTYLTGEELGFCKPMSDAVTGVGFGGKTKFANLGEFIQYIYKYGVMAAGVLAVVMIIAAGFNWVMSGGASDKITESKKKIGDAMMGLFLAVLSYAILNIINPYMVNLRLPNVWLINTSAYGIDFCNELPSIYSEKFALVGGKTKTISEDLVKSKAGNIPYNISYPAKGTQEYNPQQQRDWACGNQFLYSSGSSKVCRGHFCQQSAGSTNMCVPLFDDSGESYKCMSGIINGSITNNGIDLIGTLTGEGWVDGASAMNEIDLYVVCKNGNHFLITSSERRFINKYDTKGKYVIAARDEDLEKGVKNCSNVDEVAGFVLFPDFDEKGSLWLWGDFDWFDEPHFVGKKPSKSDATKGQGQDLGDRYTSDAFFEAVKNNSAWQGKDARSYLIPKESILVTGTGSRGYQLNIELKNIKDID